MLVKSIEQDKQDTFRRRLKAEWNALWTERFNDKFKAEGVTVRDYPLLLIDRGVVIFASRDAKEPSFSDIMDFWQSQGCVYAPHPSAGGWGKFIRTKIRKHSHSTTRLAPITDKQPRKKPQRQKGKRGWLHVE